MALDFATLRTLAMSKGGYTAVPAATMLQEFHRAMNEMNNIRAGAGKCPSNTLYNTSSLKELAGFQNALNGMKVFTCTCNAQSTCTCDTQTCTCNQVNTGCNCNTVQSCTCQTDNTWECPCNTQTTACSCDYDGFCSCEGDGGTCGCQGENNGCGSEMGYTSTYNYDNTFTCTCNSVAGACSCNNYYNS